MKKYLILTLLGALLTLAFAPFYLFIFAAISLCIFFNLLEKTQSKKSIFLSGFFFGFGHFLTGNYWISISLLVDAKQFAWLIPFAITLIPAALATYIGFFALTYKYFTKRFKLDQNYEKIIIFAILWTLFEILRSYLFTGFPWNLIGYIFAFSEIFSQSTNIFGIYGLSFLTILFSLIPNLIIKKEAKIFSAVILTIAILNICYGFFYINDKKLIQKDVKLRLVQANITQKMKWDQDQKRKNLTKTIKLTKSKGFEEIDSVIWSETSLPYLVLEDYPLFIKIREAIPQKGSLISGGLRATYNEGKFNKIYNSVFIFDQKGPKEYYDKHHLVPFGEYVPLQEYLPFVKKITQGSIGFSKGPGPRTLKAEKFSFSPLICYEVIFSDKIIDKKSRPELLVNLTNDAWFGNSTGPYQHLAMSKIRAIEYGIALVRTANTGISAFFDPFGRVIKKIDLNKEGIIDVNLVVNKNPTIYQQYGYLPLMIFMFLFVITVMIFRKR